MRFFGFSEDIYNVIMSSNTKKTITFMRENKFNVKFAAFSKSKGACIQEQDIIELINQETNNNSSNSVIPFLPIDRLNSRYELQDAKDAFEKLIETGSFTSGVFVDEFEKEIRDFYQAEFCVATNSGTDALVIALLACGVGFGDEVILPANSFSATENAVFMVGAKPIYVDVDQWFNLDPDAAEQAITLRTKAIIPVCLYGKLPQLQKIKDIAELYHLYIITDAAQCFGIEETVRFSNIAVFSFNPYKNFGVFGKGGALITNDEQLGRKSRNFSYHGFEAGKKNVKIRDFGLNSRLDNLQAAIALAKAPYFVTNMLKRSYLAYKYCALLRDAQQSERLIIPDFSPQNTWHLYPVFARSAKQSDKLIRTMKDLYNIELNRYYPILSYQQKTAFNAVHYGDYHLENTELLHQRLFHLPIHNHMSIQELNKIVESIYVCI